ncbi:MAG: hypothetical protein D3923_16560 [Candidatus Electrothrix sp. AR3]|nr:hypothetical protein [Candidatus Electrothrix sp. AR3]
MKKKTFYLSLLAVVTFINPYGNEATAQSARETATKQVKRDYRKTADGQGALTKAMIESCIALKVDVDASYVKIGKAQDAFDKLNREINNLGEYLKATKSRLDSSGDKSIRAEYDSKVKIYNSKIPGLDKKLELYRKKVSSYEQKSSKFDVECNGQPYYGDDYAEVVKKVGRGM